MLIYNNEYFYSALGLCLSVELSNGEGEEEGYKLPSISRAK
jgi:hypothetical protein